MTLGKRIRSIRRARDMTQAQLADACGLHVSIIHRLERDKLVASRRMIDVLHTQLGIPYDVFFQEHAHDATSQLPSHLDYTG